MEPLEGALGSAVEWVLRHAGMPVMVVRRDEG
jgi:nucleotide-binding universal stress UspA family protein